MDGRHHSEFPSIALTITLVATVSGLWVDNTLDSNTKRFPPFQSLRVGDLVKMAAFDAHRFGTPHGENKGRHLHPMIAIRFHKTFWLLYFLLAFNQKMTALEGSPQAKLSQKVHRAGGSVGFFERRMGNATYGAPFGEGHHGRKGRDEVVCMTQVNLGNRRGGSGRNGRAVQSKAELFNGVSKHFMAD